MAQTILIVDDDPTQRRLLETLISRAGYRVMTARGGEEGVDILLDAERGKTVDLVLLDLVMPDLDGMGVLEQVRPNRPDLPIIVLTAQSGVDTIVKAMRAGALDFIVKPASPERLQVSIENLLKLSSMKGEISRLQRKIEGEMTFDDLIAESSGMKQVISIARRASDSSIPILIEGESGVGKEMIARAIQGSGERAGRPFVTVNCGAIPENLVESILFGHEKGAFTGAHTRHVGKFQEASGGTLFLDEIGELPQDMQVKLLRALQEGEVDPIGAKKPVKVDIRLISATNRDLQDMVTQNTFREDLYYRLNVFPLVIPPLRERQEDIGPLVEHFCASIAAAEGRPVRGVTPEAMDMLQRHEWTGNVRQLENAVFRAVVLCDGELLRPEDFPQIAATMGVAGTPAALPGPAAEPITAPAAGGGAPAGGNGGLSPYDDQGDIRPLAEIEEAMIRKAIDHYKGQMSEVARRLGIGRSTLYRKVREFGLEV